MSNTALQFDIASAGNACHTNSQLCFGRPQSVTLTQPSLTTHIPNKQEQTVRYYGYYSNKSRGMRAKAEAASLEADNASRTADNSPAIGDSTVDNIVSLTDNRSALTRKRFNKNWARLIQKVYDVDPLSCPKKPDI